MRITNVHFFLYILLKINQNKHSILREEYMFNTFSEEARKTIIMANREDIPNANIIDVPAVLVQSRGVIDFVYLEEPFTFKVPLVIMPSIDLIGISSKARSVREA